MNCRKFEVFRLYQHFTKVPPLTSTCFYYFFFLTILFQRNNVTAAPTVLFLENKQAMIDTNVTRLRVFVTPFK